MSVARRLLPALLAMAGTGAGGMLKPAIAAEFDQQEVDPNRIIAIAAPVNNSLHQLLILEQLSDVRPCWSEDSNGARVEPLLVNFDFTDICGRSNDSNGYSLRVGGQDLGVGYRLRVVRRGGDLILEAASVRNPNTEVIEIGRAQATQDFTRLELNPGWRMTKRTFNGETLQHIYLTNDQPLAQVLAEARSDRGGRLASRLEDGRPYALSASRSPSSTLRPTVPTDRPPAFDRRPDYNSRPDDNSRPNYNSQPDYRSRPDYNSRPATSRDYETRPISGGISLRPPTGVRPSGSGTTRPNNDNLPSVAVRPTPNGLPRSTGSEVDRSGDWDNPPSSRPTSNQIYRVIVNSTSASQQDQVRSLVPDAFRANVNGRTVMQAGLFRDRSEADAVHQQLLAANLPSRILTETGDIPTAQSTPGDLPAAPRGRIVVVIDPGHGGRDPGAVGVGGLQEVQVVNPVAQRVASLLQQQGIQVVMTRRDNRTLELSDRVAIAQRANATAFISIHANSAAASSANGTETFYASSRGASLARSIQSNLIQATGMNNRGVKQARFYVIRNTSMPSALVELGFVSNSSDARRLRDPDFRNRMADAIARGILQYLRSR